jgi:hypothetical protein
VKIYIAAPWADKDKMPEIASKFDKHEITHRWWDVDSKDGYDAPHAKLAKQAIDDVTGVSDADLVVLINSAKSEGKAFEQGVAVTLNKPIVAVGKLGEHSLNVFHYLPSYRWVDSVEDAVKVLDTIQWLVNNASRS